MSTTTDLSTERAILHWAADRLEHLSKTGGLDPRVAKYELLRQRADDMPSTPTTYGLLPEPGPEVTELWDRHRERACAFDDPLSGVRLGWLYRGHLWQWLAVLDEADWLSTVPPEQTEASDA